MRSSQRIKWNLDAYAEEQAGLFTAKQAQKLGFSRSNQTYHVKAGNWVRVHRGIYRLASYPAGRQAEMARWRLWSSDWFGMPQGVYSHATALAAYLAPEKKLLKVHLTVPIGFRRSVVPAPLALHYADLPKSDIAQRDGYCLTTPLRTILDLQREGILPRADLSKVLLEVVNRGLITRDQVKKAKISESVRRQFEALIGGKRR